MPTTGVKFQLCCDQVFSEYEFSIQRACKFIREVCKTAFSQLNVLLALKIFGLLEILYFCQVGCMLCVIISLHREGPEYILVSC